MTFVAAYVDSFDEHYRVAFRETFWEEFEGRVWQATAWRAQS